MLWVQRFWSVSGITPKYLARWYKTTADQDLSVQRDRLDRECAVRMFEDVISRKTFDYLGLSALLDYDRLGDTLAVIRLGSSLKEMPETVADL